MFASAIFAAVDEIRRRRNHGFPYRKEGRDSLPGSTVETPQVGML
jgi:hypothetical protein